MSRNRLSYALENLRAADWKLFETFASKFLAAELPNYRNMAATYGDKGRDGEIYCIGENPSILFQMSVTTDWDTKIKSTVKRLKENFTDIKELIYVTNQEIGPAADELKRDLLRNDGIILDIRDHSWFVDRENTNSQRAIASEELSVAVVDPILSTKKVTDKVARAMTGQESRIGWLHLALAAEDKSTEKGLTKGCFEALTLAALHDTNPHERLRLDEVVERVMGMLPASNKEQVAMYTENALLRLSKKGGRVKHWRNTKDFCLASVEIDALKEKLGAFLIEEAEVESAIAATLKRHVKKFADNPEKADSIAGEVKRCSKRPSSLKVKRSQLALPEERHIL